MAKVLYIEDIEENLTLVQKIISASGRELFWANNAKRDWIWLSTIRLI